MNDPVSRFDTVLVANRGEIAVRVIRACRRLGYRSVAVYSAADRDSPPVQQADSAVFLGEAPLAYLDIDAIVAAALHSGAQAVHPGYGFLSERAAFARAVQQAGLIFIGPDAAAIEAMGDKAAAKQRLRAAGVPCVPGYDGAAQDDGSLCAQALRIGLPVMIKAVAGGGGRGMRRVASADDLPAQLASARSEAANAFGDGRLLLEKLVSDARHVEVQIVGDRYGQVIHLGERDCSVQRRNQKIIEEAPSPAVDADLRERMGAAAVAAAQAVDYVGAGTVEFLLAPDGEFHFLEMNTRLQVEHAVTECVYDLDLVEWQLRIAQGEPLPLSQGEVTARRRGWAMEARLCAEDPARDFLPQTGSVLAWRPAAGEGVRIDHALADGLVIAPHYDSLQAKFIAQGETREQARRRLRSALQHSALLGVASNRDFLIAVLDDDAFVTGDFSTALLPQRFAPDRLASLQRATALQQALAALLLLRLDAQQLQAAAGFAPELENWHSAATPCTSLRLGHDGGTTHCRIHADAGTVELDHDNERTTVALQILRLLPGEVHFLADGRQQRAAFVRDGAQLWLSSDRASHGYRDLTYAAAAGAAASASGRLLAPMDGRIVAVQAQVGAAVRRGEILAVLEAMKMEFAIAADSDGVVDSVDCREGQQVRARQLLVTLQPR